MNEFSNKMFTANEMEICGAIGFVLGIVSVFLTAAILSAISSRQEPSPTDDYFDLEYERWRVQKQAEAEINRMKKN